jgi:hypothetical protein
MCQYSKIYPHPNVRECGGSKNNYGTDKNLEKLMKNARGTGTNVLGKEREIKNAIWPKKENGSTVNEILANRAIEQLK